MTSKLELEVLRKAFLLPRTALGLRTRRRMDRPTTYPLVVDSQGSPLTIEIPVADYPCIIATPLFDRPGYLSGIPCPDGITILSADIRQIAGPTFKDVAEKYRLKYAGIRLDYKIEDFARFIAKIAYGFAVLELGLGAIARSYVLGAIRGKSRDIGQWVGCEPGPSRNPTTGLHALRLVTVNGDIIVYVRLFAQFDAREYTVVCGRLTTGSS